MTRANYSPGDWVAFSSEDLWMLAELPPDDERLGQLWPAVLSGDADAVLGQLLTDGLGALPGFVLYDTHGPRPRSIVRNPATLSLIDTQGNDITVAGPNLGPGPTPHTSQGGPQFASQRRPVESRGSLSAQV